MRTDYALYVVALIFFIITVYAAITMNELYVYALAVVGIVFIGLGYMARPKATISAPSAPAPPPPKPAPEATPQPKTEPVAEPEKEQTQRTTRKTTRRRKKT
jgi:hypothetical protein